jgi:hypothetical protein
MLIDKSTILSEGDPKLCNSCEGLGNTLLLGDVTDMDSSYTLESQNNEALIMSTEKEQLNGTENLVMNTGILHCAYAVCHRRLW